MQKNRNLPVVVLPGLTKSFLFTNFIATTVSGSVIR